MQKKKEFEENQLISKLLRAEVNPFEITKIRHPAITAAIEGVILRDHFTAFLTSDEEVITILPELSSIPQFTEAEIHQTARRKATGIDNIANEHLIGSSKKLSKFWKLIFNHCMKRCTIPEDWKTSLLFLLYKGKDSKNYPICYRGISLLCSAFKVFTKLIQQRLEPWWNPS